MLAHVRVAGHVAAVAAGRPDPAAVNAHRAGDAGEQVPEAFPAEPHPEAPWQPHVIPHAEATGELDVAVRVGEVSREGHLGGEGAERVDALAGDLPLVPLVASRQAAGPPPPR